VGESRSLLISIIENGFHINSFSRLSRDRIVHSASGIAGNTALTRVKTIFFNVMEEGVGG
jgi:hypothetical protein